MPSRAVTPSPAVLRRTDGAASIGTAAGPTVEAALAAKVVSATLAGTTGGTLVGSKRTGTSSQLFSLAKFHQNRAWNFVTDFGAVGDNATDNTAAFNAAVDEMADGDTLEIPIGEFNFDSPPDPITKRINIIGQSTFRSKFIPTFVSVDQVFLDFAGTSGARIQDVTLKRFTIFAETAAKVRAINLTWVNKSLVEEVYFYNCYRGAVLDNCFGNNYRNIKVFNCEKETWLVGDECNSSHWDHVEARSVSADGIKVTGNNAALKFTACDVEGIDDANNYGFLIAPATGKKVVGITFTGCYFETVKGICVAFLGIDADSVQGLHMHGNYFFPGSAAHYGSAAGQAAYAIQLANVNGFEICGNFFDDILTAAIFRDATEANGRVWNNAGRNCPALTNSANAFSASVSVVNNFKGRRVEYRSAVPAAGTYTAGDLVVKNDAATIDANNMVLTGWARMTTGSAHVVGTDWARLYASHLSPAT